MSSRTPTLIGVPDGFAAAAAAGLAASVGLAGAVAAAGALVAAAGAGCGAQALMIHDSAATTRIPERQRVPQDDGTARCIPLPPWFKMALGRGRPTMAGRTLDAAM